MEQFEVVVWKNPVGEGINGWWQRVGGPGPREAMNIIWKATRDAQIAQGRQPQVWIRTVK